MRRFGSVLAIAIFASAGLPLSTAGAAVERPFPLVTVNGEGAVAFTPDLAHATGGVSSEAKSPREAAEANAGAMNGLIAALRQTGIEERDVRTAQFSISPMQAQRGREGQPQIVGYRVTNQVRVTVRDVSKVGPVLDALIAAGATNVAGVEFTAANPAQVLDEARKAAFADAKRKAELYARAAGAQVGRAVAITESGAVSPRAFAARASAAEAMPPPPPTPIAVGEQMMSAHVTVSFELNQ